MTPPLRIEPVAPGHRAAWGRLYAGYADFYRVEQTEPMRERVWSWLMDPAHELEGLVAIADDARPIGLAHIRRFARPLSATTGGFLDDLFVDPAHRGSGAAQALIAAIAAEGRRRGWSVIRWITARDNERARKVYDALAAETAWVTYDLKL
jgi:GNAT superfamily N-acetyltransferase